VRFERAETEPQPWNRSRFATALKLSLEELADLVAAGARGGRTARRSTRLRSAWSRPHTSDLTQMQMIGPAVLVLDDHGCTGRHLGRNKFFCVATALVDLAGTAK
jgi:hypothetical protein